MKYLLSVLSLVIFFISCGKSEAPLPAQTKILDRIIETTQGGGYSATNNFLYDNDGKIARISHRSTTPGNTDSFFTAFHRVSGKVTQMTIGLRTSSVPMEFFIDYHATTGALSRLIRLLNGKRDTFYISVTMPTVTIDHVYTHAVTQQLTNGSKAIMDFSSGNMGNYKVYGNPSSAPIDDKVFTYDSKKSPFNLSLDEIILMYGQFHYLTMGVLNNATEQKSLTGGTHITSSYTYNSDETPAVAIATFGTGMVRTYEYLYK